MSKLISFKEFLDTPRQIDEEMRLTLASLAEAYPIINNLPLVQKALNNTNSRFSASEVNSVLRVILQRSAQLGKAAPTQKPQDQVLTICEQNFLTISAVALSAALAGNMLTSLDRLSKVASAIAEKG
jgi:hypothetical protein